METTLTLSGCLLLFYIYVGQAGPNINQHSAFLHYDTYLFVPQPIIRRQNSCPSSAWSANGA